MRSTGSLLALLFPLLVSACGDVPHVAVGVAFPDQATQLATKRLLIVVREEPQGGNGCAALWSRDVSPLSESRSYVDYPQRNDVLAAPVKLAQYPTLSIFVYALPARDTTSKAIAGGCEDIAVDATGGVETSVTLVRPPPGF